MLKKHEWPYLEWFRTEQEYVFYRRTQRSVCFMHYKFLMVFEAEFLLVIRLAEVVVRVRNKYWRRRWLPLKEQ